MTTFSITRLYLQIMFVITGLSSGAEYYTKGLYSIGRSYLHCGGLDLTQQPHYSRAVYISCRCGICGHSTSTYMFIVYTCL